MREKGELAKNTLATLKGAFFGLIITLIGILIFAGIIKVCGISEKTVKPVNQFIKIISLFFGCFFSVKGKMGYLKGGIIGIVYMMLTYLVFALFFGGKLGYAIFIDLAFGCAIGALSGIFTVNVKKDG